MDNIVILKGTPYEQGVQQGKILIEDIKTNIKNIKENMAKNKVDMDKYRSFIEKNVDFMTKEHPEIMEEIKGIADGSGLCYDDILIINIPAYFMLQYFNQECSMIMARGKATADGCTYLIKNRDMKMTVLQAVIERHYPDGKAVVELNGAGIVTYPGNGINKDGLAIATTGFWSKHTTVDLDDIARSHMFVNIRFLLMNCKTVAEVIEYLKTSPRMNGLNIIAVDSKDACVIETTRDAMHIEYDNGDGVLYRTNHYILDDVKYLNPTFEEYPSTFMRHERITELLNERKGKIRFQDLFRIMSDHKNEPINAICRHPNEFVTSETVSSSMCVLEDLEVWTTLTNPCKSLRRSSLKEE